MSDSLPGTFDPEEKAGDDGFREVPGLAVWQKWRGSRRRWV
jgi:hypothetical protein